MQENSTLHKALHLLTRPLVLLAFLVVALTLGSDRFEEKGVWCLYEADEGIGAKVYGAEIADYISRDSGFTWEKFHQGDEVQCEPEIKFYYLNLIHKNVYRIIDGAIEVSQTVISYDTRSIHTFQYLTYVELEYFEKATGMKAANLENLNQQLWMQKPAT